MKELESFVSEIYRVTNQNDIEELKSFISKKIQHMSFNEEELDNAFDCLELPLCTLGCLAVLFNYTNLSSITSLDKLAINGLSFIKNCSQKQLLRMPFVFSHICHHLVKNVHNVKAFRPLINMLIRAIELLSPTPKHLTDIHGDLCEACYRTKFYRPALPFLETDYAYIAGRFEGIHLLRYFYYGGIILLQMGMYKRAVYILEQCITLPASSVNETIISAYQKFIIGHLLESGSVPPLPRYASRNVTNYARSVLKVYNELTLAFRNNNTEELKNLIKSNEETFKNDGNLSLVEKLPLALAKHNIKKLTNTFVTLSLNDVVDKVGVSDVKQVEHLIFEMITDGQIFATINQITGMVCFEDDPEQFNSTSSLELIDSASDYITKLDKFIKHLDRVLELEPLYIQQTCASSSFKTQCADDDDVDMYMEE